MPMTSPVWTPENVERLRTYWAQGLSTSQIAAKLRVSKPTIIHKAHRLGLSRPSPIVRRDSRASLAESV